MAWIKCLSLFTETCWNHQFSKCRVFRPQGWCAETVWMFCLSECDTTLNAMAGTDPSGRSNKQPCRDHHYEPAEQDTANKWVMLGRSGWNSHLSRMEIVYDAARERRRLNRLSLKRHTNITKSSFTERRGWWKNSASKKDFSVYWVWEEAGEAGGSRTEVKDGKLEVIFVESFFLLVSHFWRWNQQWRTLFTVETHEPVCSVPKEDWCELNTSQLHLGTFCFGPDCII